MTDELQPDGRPDGPYGRNLPRPTVPGSAGHDRGEVDSVVRYPGMQSASDVRTVAAGVLPAYIASARFPARSVRIDNLTNQWLFLAGASAEQNFIPPYTLGVVRNLRASGTVNIVPLAPAQITELGVLAGESFVVTLYSKPQLEQPGVGVGPPLFYGPNANIPAITIGGNLYNAARVDGAGFLQVSTGTVGNSKSASGSATAPAAGAQIATSGVLGAGAYDVQVLTDYGGTVTAAETFSNMQIQVAAAVIGPVFTAPGALAAAVPQTFALSMSGITAITINAVGAGGIAAVYQALLIFTQRS